MTVVHKPLQLLAATDKFRGTASATEASQAAATAARAAGLATTVLPLSDGGEGFLEAMGGAVHHTVVTGPLGEPVEAAWRLRPGRGGAAPVAIIEAAQAAGLLLAGGAARNDSLRATTRGVGELMVAAFQAGAREIIVGCGGSASTDGGAGAVDAVARAGGLDGARLRAAVDVETRFVDAARVFAPQKGADAAAVVLLTQRLDDIAHRYMRDFHVDVRGLRGSGAAGGLGGGLAALGASIESGFDIVAHAHDLRAEIAAADIIVTGEGRLDATSLDGKVVGGILALAPPGARVLIVAGDVEAGVESLARAAGPAEVTVVSLVERFGRDAAMTRTVELIGTVVADYLARPAR